MLREFHNNLQEIKEHLNILQGTTQLRIHTFRSTSDVTRKDVNIESSNGSPCNIDDIHAKFVIYHIHYFY